MFEPAQFPDGFGIGLPIIFEAGFKTPPGGDIGSTNHMLNDHTYCCQLSPGICSETGEPPAGDAHRCQKFHQNKFGQRYKDAKRLGIPFINSEFGACMDTNECYTEITQVADVNEDMNSVGWAYWEFKTYKDLTTSAGDKSEGFYNWDGSLQAQKVKALSRTYVQYAQGTVLNSKFAAADGDQLKKAQFVAEIELDTTIDAPTVIHALHDFQDAWYPKGWDVEVMDTAGRPIVGVTTVSDQIKNTITITAKKTSTDSTSMRVCVKPKYTSLDCKNYEYKPAEYLK